MAKILLKSKEKKICEKENGKKINGRLIKRKELWKKSVMPSTLQSNDVDEHVLPRNFFKFRKIINIFGKFFLARIVEFLGTRCSLPIPRKVQDYRDKCGFTIEFTRARFHSSHLKSLKQWIYYSRRGHQCGKLIFKMFIKISCKNKKVFPTARGPIKHH